MFQNMFACQPVLGKAILPVQQFIMTGPATDATSKSCDAEIAGQKENRRIKTTAPRVSSRSPAPAETQKSLQ
jgi:hypothetical protein